MLKIHLFCTTTFLIFLSAPCVHAQTPTCKGLTGDQKALAKELLESQHPYDCCDDTIAACLKKGPVCDLAYRLSENICRRISKHQDRQEIVRGLSRRARSMTGRSKANIDLSFVPPAGVASAKVVLVEYACARCPYCSKSTPKMYNAVVKGQLKGKVRLYFKPFPIRSHEFSKESGLGFIAAAKLNRFWEFLLHSYDHFDSFCILKQTDWAEAAGMDRVAFEQAIKDPVTRKLLVDSKKEGIVNKVEATPTFFINGREYVGDLDHEELVDVLQEEYRRIRGFQYR